MQVARLVAGLEAAERALALLYVKHCGLVGMREGNIALVLVLAAGIAEIADGLLRLEAIAVGLVDRIALDPQIEAHIGARGRDPHEHEKDAGKTRRRKSS